MFVWKRGFCNASFWLRPLCDSALGVVGGVVWRQWETSSWETAVQDFCWLFYFLRHDLGAVGRTWVNCAVPDVSKAYSAQEVQIILLFCPLLQEEKAKAYKKEKQREKKRRAEEDLTFEEDDEMAAVMGFSGFGSTKKNH